MSHNRKISPAKDFTDSAHISDEQYRKMYKESIENPEQFWAKQADRISWYKKWDKVVDSQFSVPVSINWYLGGELNLSYNCIDRHLPDHAERTAIIFEADSPNVPAKKITYQELHDEVCRYANVLKKHGVKKGDRVTLYLPMISETAFAMLACARIGAIHMVVFGGFSADSIRDRIHDSDSEWVITADEGFRGGKKVPLLANMNQALLQCPGVKKVFIIRHTGESIQMVHERDVWMHEELLSVAATCEPERMNSEDPLFILYTSGSTNKPKGVLHTTGGYAVYTNMTFQYVFDYRPEDVFWCTADVGWITGHSYVVYGPLSNAATVLMFEGVPSFPDFGRFWEVIDKHQVSIFYTAPTAIRALMKEGDQWVKKHSRKSLRLLGSVGEPINPQAWLWYYNIVGEARCPVVDTWWQTETGGVMISTLPGAHDMKPGSAALPFFGIQPVLLTPEGQELTGAAEGLLALRGSWPGQMRTVYKSHQRFEETYFSSYLGLYFTGDGCKRDEDGYYWITGRVDDVLNVSGHRIGTAEIESALVKHKSVAEAAVVGYPHDIKGQGVYVYVTLKQGIPESEKLKKELIQWVGKCIGPTAKPDILQWASSLPKTRSGKIMRRILRKIAENQMDALGDISTLADPGVVEDLVKNRIRDAA